MHAKIETQYNSKNPVKVPKWKMTLLSAPEAIMKFRQII